jgi:antiviral helicase SKI2
LVSFCISFSTKVQFWEITDLKLKDIQLVQKYRIYNNILQKMAENKCHGCIKLKENLMLLKEQQKHKEELNALKYQMSDEALQQMPDFQGRVKSLSLYTFSCI